MISFFTAAVVKGAGRGKTLGTPTINLDPSFLEQIQEGIYACHVILGGKQFPAVLHAGERPVFHDTPSIEVHLLTPPPDTIPAVIAVELVERLRPVQDFESVNALQQQIQKDIVQARATLGLDD